MIRLAAALAVCAACQGPAPAPGQAEAAPLEPEPGVLRLGGSGAAGPLARALAAAYSGELRPVVEESIGTGAGVRAVADGAVDLALGSRPLSPAELKLGLRIFPVATDAVVLAANRAVAADDLSTADLLALFAGERRSPGGSPVTLLLRDSGESANLTVDGAIPGMAEARPRGYARGLTVVYRDEAMLAALFGSRQAIGLSSLALLEESGMPLKALRLAGRAPSLAALASGEWPLRRTIWLAARPQRLARVQAFLDHARSARGRALIEAAGYLPERP